ncbi:MAG: hypothetical protein ATN36_01170 [Epulopiscium sp. Nele67-Bin005]|nr:MAG: hypothetical protein ATN36_01170 [Epulopiscium sp. Nele67-Bin005]
MSIRQKWLLGLLIYFLFACTCLFGMFVYVALSLKTSSVMAEGDFDTHHLDLEITSVDLSENINPEITAINLQENLNLEIASNNLLEDVISQEVISTDIIKIDEVQLMEVDKQFMFANSSHRLDFLSQNKPTALPMLDYVETLITTYYEPMEAIVTFYTGLAAENGGFEGMNAIGGLLEVGSIAAPKDIPFGTSIIIPNLPSDVNTAIFEVDDRGGAIKRLSDNKIKLDIYVPRLYNETDREYYKRVNALGVIETQILYTPSPKEIPAEFCIDTIVETLNSNHVDPLNFFFT